MSPVWLFIKKRVDQRLHLDGVRPAVVAGMMKNVPRGGRVHVGPYVLGVNLGHVEHTQPDEGAARTVRE